MKKAILLIPVIFLITFLSCKKLERIVMIKTVSADETTLVVKGELVDAGAQAITYGFCWSTEPGASFTDSKKVVGSSEEATPFQTTIAGLVPGTRYYIRAFASGESGILYGEELSLVVSSGTVEYYYDDGTAENGWRFNSGFDGSLGNLFPISTSGSIKSINVFFTQSSDAGSGTLTIDVYNSDFTRIGGVSAFTPAVEVWTTKSANITFNGSFFVMVTWKTTTGPTNYLGSDENGPNVSMDLAWYLNDEGQWAKLSSDGNVPSIFLIRVTATLFSNKSIPAYVEFDATRIPDADGAAGLQSIN